MEIKLKAFILNKRNLHKLNEFNQWDKDGFESSVQNIYQRDTDNFIIIVKIKGSYPFIESKWDGFIENKED